MVDRLGEFGLGKKEIKKEKKKEKEKEKQILK